MRGKMKSFKNKRFIKMSETNQKQIVAENFIKQVNPYKQVNPLKFDLRGYAQYANEHKLTGLNMPVEVIKKFEL